MFVSFVGMVDVDIFTFLFFFFRIRYDFCTRRAQRQTINSLRCMFVCACECVQKGRQSLLSKPHQKPPIIRSFLDRVFKFGWAGSVVKISQTISGSSSSSKDHPWLRHRSHHGPSSWLSFLAHKSGWNRLLIFPGHFSLHQGPLFIEYSIFRFRSVICLFVFGFFLSLFVFYFSLSLF